LGITAYGQFFSWEDSLFYPGHDDESNEQYIRILAHEKKSRLAYKKPDTPPEVEFTKSSGVYLLHGENRETVYVGQAKHFGKRLKAHTGDHLRNRWFSYSFFATTPPDAPNIANRVNPSEVEAGEGQHVDASLSLDMLEAILRTAMEPKLNLQSGRWGEISLYAQSVEYEFMYVREVWEQNERLLKKIKKLRKSS